MSDDRLSRIFDKTHGYCHLCGGRLAFGRYGEQWEIEHSIPKARGGTDHMNNLFAAHVPCNRSKQACSTRGARAKNGLRCAPYSKAKRKQVRTANTMKGAAAGAAIGSLFGPAGTFIGGVIGALAGDAKRVNGWRK